MSEYSANAYVTALNYLLNDRKHITQIGDATVVYWSEGDDEIAQEALRIGLVSNRRRTMTLRSTMRSIASATGRNRLRRPCHIIGLSPNEAVFLFVSSAQFIGRLQRTTSTLITNGWKLCTPHERAYLSPWELLRETINPFSQDESICALAGAFLRSILQNTRYRHFVSSNTVALAC